MYGFCVPTFEGDAISAISDSKIETFNKVFNVHMLGDKLTSYIADIGHSLQMILVASITAILLGYFYLLLIKFIGALIIWLSIILLELSLIGGGVLTYYVSQTSDEDRDYYDLLVYAALAIWGVAFLFLCCVCCCWN